jgi:hypothetical protein
MLYFLFTASVSAGDLSFVDPSYNQFAGGSINYVDVEPHHIPESLLQNDLQSGYLPEVRLNSQPFTDHPNFPQVGISRAERLKDETQYFFLTLPRGLIEGIMKASNQHLSRDKQLNHSSFFHFFGTLLSHVSAGVQSQAELVHPYVFSPGRRMDAAEFLKIFRCLDSIGPNEEHVCFT